MQRLNRLPQWVYLLVVFALLAAALVLPRGVVGPLLVGGAALSGLISLGFGLQRLWRTGQQGHLDRVFRYGPIVTAAVGALLMLPEVTPLVWTLGLLVVLVGVVLAVPTTQSPDTGDDIDAWRWFTWADAMLVLAALPLLLIVLLRALPEVHDNLAFLGIHAQHGLLVLGVVLLAIGAGGMRFRRLDWRVVGGLAALGVVALLPRLWRLGMWQPYMVEEWLFIQAVSYLRSDVDNPLVATVSFFVSSTYLFSYWQSMIAYASGGGMFGIRLASAFIGAGTCVATAALAYEWRRDRRFALLAGLLLAFLPVYLHFSRIALYNIVDPLFGVLAAAALLRGVRTNERFWFALGGAMVGVSGYFYEAGRLLTPAVILVWWGVVLVYDGAARRAWRGLIVAVGVAVPIAVLPVLYLDAIDISVVQRLNATQEVGSGDASFILRDYLGVLREVTMRVTTLPDKESSRYYGGTLGMVPPWLLFPFLLGAIRFLARPFDRVALLGLIWIGATIVGNSLLGGTFTARYITAMPWLALLIAGGLWELAALLPNRVRWHSLWAVVVVMCAVNSYHYFAQVVPGLNDQYHGWVVAEGYYDLDDFVFGLQALPTNAEVHVLAEHHHGFTEPGTLWSIADYFNPRLIIHIVDTDEFPADDYVSDLGPWSPRTFMLMPDDSESLAAIESNFRLSEPIWTSYPFKQDVALVRYDVIETDRR